MSREERREFIRLQAYHCIKYRVLSTTTAETSPFMSATVKDIGGGGICLRTEENVPEFALIEVKINFPHIATAIYAVAKVIWIKQRDKIRRYEIGVKFVEIQELTRKIIDEQVKGVFDKLKKKGKGNLKGGE